VERILHFGHFGLHFLGLFHHPCHIAEIA